MTELELCYYNNDGEIDLAWFEKCYGNGGDIQDNKLLYYNEKAFWEFVKEISGLDE